MTATPIPRTLNMSLAGIRDMSIIETPPKDRLSIQTNVVKFDQEVISPRHPQLSSSATVRSTSFTTASSRSIRWAI